jgi:hypothetical protein
MMVMMMMVMMVMMKMMNECACEREMTRCQDKESYVAHLVKSASAMRVIRGNIVQTIDTCIQTTINAERHEQTLNASHTTATVREDICSWSEAVNLHVCAWPSTAVREMQESTQSKHLALGSTIEVWANDDDRTHMHETGAHRWEWYKSRTAAEANGQVIHI